MARLQTIRLPFSANIKLMLVSFAFIIVAGTLYYTQLLVEELQKAERRTLLLFSNSLQSLYNTSGSSTDGTDPASDLLIEIVNTIYFPTIVTDKHGVPTGLMNQDGGISYDGWVINVEYDTLAPAEVQQKVLQDHVVRMGGTYEPLRIYSITQREQIVVEDSVESLVFVPDSSLVNYIYYDDSAAIKQLRLLPYVEIIIISMFILIGYIGFSHIKRNEQSNIWVGMAKETAHQLGTPLSSLMGWIELMKMTPDDKGQVLEAADEMEHDVERLNKIAHRFSKIGSAAEVKPVELNKILANVVTYFERRLPHLGRKIELTLESAPPVYVAINVDLFEWVFENLVRNAVDAIDRDDGKVWFTIRQLRNTVIISVNDNGTGIDPKIRKDIFRPGFSTKKRGWGLGLSLAKRIVEEYHGGKIYIKDSTPGGTTFSIRLQTVPVPTEQRQTESAERKERVHA